MRKSILILFLLLASADTSGTCGENLTWKLTSSGVLTISGTGEMYDYGYYDEGSQWGDPENTKLPPWGKNIKQVKIQSGVTSIGASAFDTCTELTSVSIPKTVTVIKTYAFFQCVALTDVTIPSSVRELVSLLLKAALN